MRHASNVRPSPFNLHPSSFNLHLSPLSILLGDEGAGGKSGIYSLENLVAWAIVPYDASKRGPLERAKMLKRLKRKQARQQQQE